MSNGMNDPVLDLPLTTNSGLPLHGVAYGTTVVSDPTFGSCLGFDGTESSYINIPSAPKLAAYTAEVWIYCEAPALRSGILGTSGTDYSLWLDWNGSIDHVSSETDVHAVTGEGSIAWKQWNHVAITNDHVTVKTYVNGVELGSRAFGSGTLGGTTQALVLGRAVGTAGVIRPFKGRMARMRLYGRALTREEILRDIASDLQLSDGPLQFGASYPIAFSLLDAGRESVLFTLGDAQTLTLGLVNTSRASIKPGPAGDMTDLVSNKHWHFALRFRPGTLDASKLSLIHVKPTGWELFPETGQDGVDSLYLLWRSPQTLAPFQRVELTLGPVTVDPRGGSRTTNVELLYQQLKLGTRWVTGQRENHLTVLNEYPGGVMALDELRVDALPPLEAKVVDVWGTVLNTPRLTCTVQIRPSFFYIDRSLQPTLTDSPKKSILTLFAEDPAWTHVSSVKSVLDTGLRVVPDGELATGSLARVEAEAGKTVSLSKAEIALTISAPTTPQQTRLRMRCENIARGTSGSYYPDFDVWIPIRTGPIIAGANGNVGIATNGPSITLAVGDDDTGLKHLGDDHLAICTRGVERITVESEGDVGIAGDVTITGEINVAGAVVTGDDLYVLGKAGIATSTAAITLAVGDSDTGLKHLAEDRLAICTGGVERITVEANGSVGVSFLTVGKVGIAGNADPATIRVQGRIMDHGGYVMPVGAILPYAGAAPPPAGWLLCDGQPYAKANYGDLYAVIKDVYQVDNKDTTKFQVPNLIGRIPVGVNTKDTNDKDFHTLGHSGGDRTVTLTAAQMPKHTHSAHHQGASNRPGTTFPYLGADSKAPDVAISVGEAGGDQPHPNLQPYLTLNYIIKC